VIAVARYTPGRLMHDPEDIEAFQPFWIGLHAKISAKASARLYPSIMKAIKYMVYAHPRIVLSSL
jgi:hypothetical protein